MSCPSFVHRLSIVCPSFIPARCRVTKRTVYLARVSGCLDSAQIVALTWEHVSTVLRTSYHKPRHMSIDRSMWVNAANKSGKINSFLANCRPDNLAETLFDQGLHNTFASHPTFANILTITSRTGIKRPSEYDAKT